MNFYYAILHLKPQAAFRILNMEDYSTLEWDRANTLPVDAGGNGVGSPPTKAECDAVAAEAVALQDKVEKDLAARTVLANSDQRAVRGMREFLVAKFGTDPAMPPILKELEAQAVSARSDLDPESVET